MLLAGTAPKNGAQRAYVDSLKRRGILDQDGRPTDINTMRKREMDFATETPVNTCVDTETLTLIARAVPQVISTDCVDIPHTAPLPTREQNTFPISPLDYEEALRSVDPLHHDSV
jgi:hypothetical protein